MKISETGSTDFTPVEVAALKSEYQRLCSCDIGSHRDIMYVTQSEKIHTVNVGSLGIYRIPEKQENVNFVTGKKCKYLLRTALTAEVSLDRKSGCFAYLFACCVGSYERML